MYKKLLNIIVCPICKNSLIYSKKKLVCTIDKIFFSIKKNIPILIIGKSKLIKNILKIKNRV